MSLRDFLWDYPIILKKIYKSATPFSHILSFTLLSIFFFSFMFSEAGGNFLNRGKRDRFVEGVVGNVDRLNPLYLSNNQVDRDIQGLVSN